MFGIDFAMSSSEKGMLQRNEKTEVKKEQWLFQRRHKQWNMCFLFWHDTDLESSSSRTEKLERLFDSSCIVALMLDVNYKHSGNNTEFKTFRQQQGVKL